jgi:serine/threonine protein kinase
VRQLESFKLTNAEKLLTRHKYELGGEVSRDKAIALYRAKDINIDRIVAMKLVGEDAKDRDSAITQLIAEAQMIGRLEHPNIQPLHELSIDENGRAFYTAKLMKGSSLAKVLDDLHAKKSSAIVAFDLKKLLTIFHGVCDALAFAHAEGIVHGKLTAAQVHVGDFGEVLVTGWENARRIREGNVSFFEADVRIDIAALGDLLHHILTLTPATDDKKSTAVPHTSWKMPKALWTFTQQIRVNRGATAYPRVAKLQTEVEDFRDELGARGGRASAFDVLKQSVQKWQ